MITPMYRESKIRPFSRTIAQINRMISKGPWGTEGLFCWTAAGRFGAILSERTIFARRRLRGAGSGERGTVWQMETPVVILRFGKTDVILRLGNILYFYEEVKV